MNFATKYISRGIIYAILLFIAMIYVGAIIPWGITVVAVFYYIVCAAGLIINIAYTLRSADDKNFTEEEYEQLLKEGPFPFKIPRFAIWTIVLIVFGFSTYNGSTKLSGIYNRHIVYKNEYKKATDGLAGFYDNLWKTYLTKKDIASINKEAFIEVAKIQMENRHDGANVAWKWVHENSPIPYGEFTSFYSDLSAFITSKRNEYYDLEKNRQAIAASHNMLLDTFPNNIYNKVLGIKPIVYEYGFLSDSTNKVFSTHTENLVTKIDTIGK